MNNDFIRLYKNNYPNNHTPPFFSILNKILEKNDLNNFKAFLSQNKTYINPDLLEYILFYLLKDSNDININNTDLPNYISMLLSFGLEPNVIIDEFISKNYIKNIDNVSPLLPKGKSLLMFACEKSYFSLVKDLCEINKKKSANINYCDKNGRNCLFYLKGANDDIKIIQYLVNKDIEVNRRDIEENTVLNHLILNTDNVKLIYDFINIANPAFNTKNKQGKHSLDLINEKWIVRKNNNNLTNFEDIKKLIQLIQNKLSPKRNNNKSYLNNGNSINISNNNLIKLSTLTTMNTETESQSENDTKKNNNDIYIKLPKLSLIIDTESFSEKEDNLSTSKKIENYNQMNRMKKYFLNLLKNAENKIKENSKFIQEEIIKKKNKLEEMKKILEEKKQNIISSKQDWDNNYNLIENNLNIFKTNIDRKKQALIQKNPNSIILAQKESKLNYKYSSILNRDKAKDLIYKQLTSDLIDYMNFVHRENSKHEITLQKINNIMQQSVLESLGEGYHLHMYGSRATKLCLPWSDIDYVISYTINRHIDPLRILYDYLYTIPERFFVDMKYISGASVPVLKIYTNNEYHKISLDISMENQEHHGEECVNYIRKKIKELEVLTPMTFALKTLLQKAFLNDPYKGGLSSYGVILLIIHFLNVQNKRGGDLTMENLGKLFFDILYYYGFEEIPNPIIIDENYEKDKIFYFHQYQIMKSDFVLIDPLNITNNVAKNTRQYNNIKLAFKIGYICLFENCECGCHFQYDEINIKEDGIGHNLLGRIFNVVKREW